MINLFKIYFLKEFWELKNNKFRLLLGIILNVMVLYMLYNNLTNGEESFINIILLVGTLFIMLSSFIIMAEIIVKEFEKGTIYNLILTPYNLSTFLIVRIFIKNISDILKLALLIIISSLILKDVSSYNYIYFILFLFLGNWGLYGIGLIMASISLISNEFKLLSNIFKIIFIYMLLAFDSNILIPFSYTKEILLDIALNKEFNILNYSFDFLFNFFINSFGYFIFGIIIFKLFEQKFITGRFFDNLNRTYKTHNL